VQVFNLLPAAVGLPLAAIKEALGEAGEIGFRQAMQFKWVGIDKSGGAPLVVRKVEAVQDAVLPLLEALAAGAPPPGASPADLQSLAKRKLAALQSWKTFRVDAGPKFALERRKPATELTAEMLLKGTWREETFKEYNFDALGLPPAGGALHPLLKVRTQFRKIFTQMGFEEMPTNNYVESSFWNFDALFQPQQHPARDAHDTFFLTSEPPPHLSHRCPVQRSPPAAPRFFFFALTAAPRPQTPQQRPSPPCPPTTCNASRPPTSGAGLGPWGTGTTGRSRRRRRTCCAPTPPPSPRACSTASRSRASAPQSTFPSTASSATRPSTAPTSPSSTRSRVSEKEG
jgi:phenylalanyl-tRNA synthetase alpha subunit